MTNPKEHLGSISTVGSQLKNMALALAAVFLPVLVALPSAQAQFKLLYTFSGGADGGIPYGRVITDTSGNIYGTTFWGGNLNCNSGNGCGVVYKLAKAGTETVLYSFAGGPKDGAFPYTALIMDASGNFYGTTTAGGSASGCLGSGCGTVFKLNAQGQETVLYNFTGGADGGEPYSALISDAAGNFYGTTLVGGDLTCNSPVGCGVVYKITPAGTQTVLYSFTGGTDGAYPELDSLAMDAKGNLYGTTKGGGDPTCACGVVFKMAKGGKMIKGGKPIVLHIFKGGPKDGRFPLSGVTLTVKGSVLGTAANGGANDKGVLFKMSTLGKNFVDLHDFGAGTDGSSPFAGVNVCSNGSIVGSTSTGGSNFYYGTIFTVNSAKKETVLYDYDGSFGGGVPVATFAWKRDGAENTFFATASQGGNINGMNGSGTVGGYNSDNREQCHH